MKDTLISVVETLDIKALAAAIFSDCSTWQSKPKQLRDKIVSLCKQRITPHDLVSSEETEITKV